jgi:NadR type nicotinamide-nucleotide adenylyltransferase
MEAKLKQEPSDITKIVVFGPESTGKTTLSKQLARHYNTVWVPEYAREYLLRLNTPYSQNDVEQIAKGQIDYEDVMVDESKRILICDTNLVVIKVWMEFKYNACPKWIDEEISNRNYDLHILTAADIPYKDDPLREHPLQREELFEKYVELLDALKINYVVASGNYQQRMKIATDAINSLK